MGIPRFFYYCMTEYPEIMDQITKKDKAKCKVDFIYFDLNAIIHKVCQKIFEYGNGAQNKSMLIKNKSTNKIQDCYKQVCREIENYVNICNPQKGVYIAIDGVCGMAKCNQQRQRRFRSAMNPNLHSFDPNCISTGTIFMNNLSRYVSNFLSEKIQNDWSHLELILSNEKVVGEGEHKCVKHIKDNCQYHSIVVSPDADLFMLLLSCHNFNENRNLYIIRENVYDNINCDYIVININMLADKIISRVCEDQKINNIRKTEIILDFVFFCFFLGNDFLPPMPCIDITSQGIDTLFNVYSQNLKEKGPLFFKQNKKLILNKDSFINMLNTLSSNEENILRWKLKNNKVYNDPYLSKCLLDQDNNKIDMEKYRKLYYKAKFNKPKPLVSTIKSYIDGLLFVLRYYFDEIPSYTWYYPYHHSPFALDVAEVMQRHYNEDKNTFIKTKPMLPIQQLFCILPPTSKDLMPKCLQKHMSIEDKDIGEWMNTKLDLDTDFKKNDWEYVLLTPNIDTNKFLEIFKMNENNFDKDEIKRNCRGKIYIYYTENNECYVKDIMPY
jgi:5'-3' exonuclease